MSFKQGSFYEYQQLFEPLEEGIVPFAGVRARYVVPAEPILEHSPSYGERLDSLADHYYGAPREWRHIADANPDILFPEDLLLLRAEDTPATAPNVNAVEQTTPDPLGEIILIPRRRGREDG